MSWTWDAIHDEAVTRLKKIVSNAPTLRLFDPRLPITITVDASSYGLGAALTQQGQPVEYASRTLTSTQQRYTQSEKEMLAVQFGLERFHQYVHGQTITVETNHKHLLGISRKPLNEVSPRIQRMRSLPTYTENAATLSQIPLQPRVLPGQKHGTSRCPKQGPHNNGIRGTCGPHRRPNFDSHATGNSHPSGTVSVQRSNTTRSNLTSHTNIRNSRLALAP